MRGEVLHLVFASFLSRQVGSLYLNPMGTDANYSIHGMVAFAFFEHDVYTISIRNLIYHRPIESRQTIEEHMKSQGVI